MIETVCSVCHDDADTLFTCDQDITGKQYCEDCFLKTDCREKHGEDCETVIWSD